MKREVKYIVSIYIRVVDLVSFSLVSEVPNYISPVLHSLLLSSCCNGSDLHFYLNSSQELF